MVSILSSLGLALLSGGIKCLTEDSLGKAAFMTLDGLFSGPLGNLGQEGFDRIREVLGGPKLLDKNEDIERCSRNALLNALIAFSEVAKKEVDKTGLSTDASEDCLHFLSKAQKHFDQQLKALAHLPSHDAKLANKSLIADDLISRILANGQQERIEGFKTEFTKLALEEYTYPPQNVLYEPLSHWLSNGLPDGIHWFVYYIQTFHANLKKDDPVYCKNARRILTHKQLADLDLRTKESLARLDELMPLAEEILAVVNVLSRQISDIKTNTEEIKADTRQIREHLTKPKYNLAEQLAAGSEQYFKILTGLNGPYHFIDISEAILAGMTPAEAASSPPQLPLLATVKDAEGQEFSLGASLSARWGKEKPHILLLGDGGMGKTVSLIHLWETLLENKRQDPQKPIPLFVSLKEYNTVPESDLDNFITNRVAWHYLGVRKDPGEATNAFWDFIMDKHEHDTPLLVLLLDGFNEITVETKDRSFLLRELQEINQKASAVQMVLSSRHEMNFNWANSFQTTALQPLDARQVEDYLQSHGVAVPIDSRLQQILQNPMMLTLYTNSSEIVERHKTDSQFDFKPLTTTQGELLWNYLEAQMVKLSDLLGNEPQEFHFHKFIIRHFLPYIGYEMERGGQFDVDEKKLEQQVIEACNYFYKKEFIQAYPEYRAYLKGFNLKGLDFMEEGERFERIIELVCRKLNLMKQKRKSYEFIHQNFRDYFAAVHILNDLHREVQNSTLPQILKYRTLSVYVRRFMGQIVGETYQCEETIPTSTILMQALNAFRGVFEENIVGYSVWNIVNIWKETRLHLGAADFSHLNLSKTVLQDISFFSRNKSNYKSANFDYCLVGEKEILPQGHSDSINCVAFHPDGQSFISGSWDSTIKAWDSSTGECLATFRGHHGRVSSVAFHSNGSTFISGSFDKTIRVWDWHTGECMDTFQGHSREVKCVAFHPDGRSFISGSGDHTLMAWDLAMSVCTAIFRGHRGKVSSVAFHPDGRSFISGSRDSTIKVWDLATGECLSTSWGHHGRVSSVAFHPDGRSFISGSSDSTIKMWDLATGECLTSYREHLDKINSVAFHPDGRSLISGSGDSTIKTWDIATGECMATFRGHRGRVSSVAFHPDGHSFISGSEYRTIRVWDLATGECLAIFRGKGSGVSSVAFHPDGRSFISGAGDSTIRAWHPTTGECLAIFRGHDNRVSSLAFHPDGHSFISGSFDKTIKIWDWHTGECMDTFRGHSREVKCVVFHPDGRSFVSGSEDCTIKAWDIATGECLTTFQGHSREVKCVAFHPNGRSFISGSGDGIVNMWDLATGECMATFRKHRGRVSSVAFHPDGHYFIAGFADKTIRAWDLATGEYMPTFQVHHGSGVSSVVFHPEGRSFISGSYDTTIKAWDSATGECLATYQGHHDSGVSSLAFHPDGGSVVSGSYDNTINTWSNGTNECQITIFNQSGMYLLGCIFKNLHRHSNLSGVTIKQLRQQGILFSEKDRKQWQEAVHRIFSVK